MGKRHNIFPTKTGCMVHAYLAFIIHIIILANNNNDKFNSQVLQHILEKKKKTRWEERDASARAFSSHRLYTLRLANTI